MFFFLEITLIEFDFKMSRSDTEMRKLQVLFLHSRFFHCVNMFTKFFHSSVIPVLLFSLCYCIRKISSFICQNTDHSHLAGYTNIDEYPRRDPLYSHLYTDLWSH